MEKNTKQKLTRNLVFGLAVLGLNFSVSAQSLDLETCLKMADTANLTIRNARLDVASNKQQIVAYKSALLPKITYTGDYKYNAVLPGQLVPAQFFGGAPGTFATVQFGVPYNLSNTFQLSQVLYNPQVNYALQALAINQKVLEIQQDMTVQEMKYQVASTYFNYQAINKQTIFIAENIANMDKLISNLELMVKAELVVDIEVDKLKINRLSLVNSLQTLNATKDQLENLLKILIGFDTDKKIELASDALVQQSILGTTETVNNLQLTLVDTQLDLNAAERKGTNMAYLPSLSFYAAYNYTYNIKPEDDFRTGINSAFLGLRLDWTLFDGMEKYNKQKVNAINRTKMESQKELITQQLQMATDNAKKQIEIQKNSLEIAKEQLVLAEKVYKNAELQFKQETSNSNDLITAENGRQQAQSNLVSAYVQLRQAELSYLKSIGNIK